MKPKTYDQSKQPLDKHQSSKFCQSSIQANTLSKSWRKKSRWFFDYSTTLKLHDSLYIKKRKEWKKKMWCCVGGNQGLSLETSIQKFPSRWLIYLSSWFDETNFRIQLFWERLSEKVHATILKGIVGDFKCTVFQRNLKESYGRPLIYVFECWRKVTKVGSTATVVRNSVLIISHITFRDCRVHFILDKLSRNSYIRKKVFFPF